MKFKKFVTGFLLFNFLVLNSNAALAELDTTTPCPVEPPCAKIEHICQNKKTPINIVRVTDCKVTIAQGNVLKVVFAQDFTTKNLCPGTKISFALKNNLCTNEGRILLPCGTQIIGKVECVNKPKVWNRNAKVLISFGEIILPNGQCGKICARVYTKDSMLKKSTWAAIAKAAGITAGSFGVGAGLGAAIGAAANVSKGVFYYGMPIGGGVGLLLGTVTPGLHYKAKAGKPIYIQLTQDFDIICSN